ARWFHRDTAGWQPAPESIAVTGTTSCLSPDGSAAMLLGQRPTVLDHTGRGQPVTDLELAGACALGAGGGIVADLFQTAGGTRSDIRVFDAAHAITWRRDVPGEALLSAHGTRVVYTSGNQAHELDLRTGAELRAVPAVRAARYDRTGALVVVDAEGHPRWLD
ncbi:hypothetical protein, partial [Actinophytocola sp.]|uniref:hypothetical protein n=1 Tax=Actinophytocola sp. TaxID=1872138 RepID=UPI002D7E9397